MHRIQRALLDYLIVRPAEKRPAPTGLMAVQGTPFFVPVLPNAGVPATWAIGYAADFTSGLVLGDLEDDAILDLLGSEGLGGIAQITWDAGWHRGNVRVHASSPDAALAQLGDALNYRMPGRYIPTAIARANLARVAVNVPSTGEPAQAIIEWTGDDGDLVGSITADRGDDVAGAIMRALREAADVRLAVRAIEAGRTALIAGEQLPAWLEAGRLRLQLALQDYTPAAATR